MFKDKLKKIVGNSEGQGNNKRKIENLVFFSNYFNNYSSYNKLCLEWRQKFK